MQILIYVEVKYFFSCDSTIIFQWAGFYSKNCIEKKVVNEIETWSIETIRRDLNFIIDHSFKKKQKQI